jgi:DNA-binding transcriptional ArsR family regulator
MGDRTRYEIVSKLRNDGPTTCGGFGIDCPPATLSHHFNVLRKAGLIRTEIAGNRRINILNEKDIEAKFPDLLRSMLQRPKRRPVRKT